MTTQRDDLAREIFIADNAGQSREASLKDWAEYDFASEQSYAHTIADGLLAAGYGKLPDIAGQLSRLSEWLMEADITDSLDVLHILAQGDLTAALERTAS